MDANFVLWISFVLICVQVTMSCITKQDSVHNTQRYGLDNCHVTWWHHYHRHHPRAKCNCSGRLCSCCLTQTYRVKNVHFDFEPCFSVIYYMGQYKLNFGVNNHELFHIDVSLAQPFKRCYGLAVKKHLFVIACLHVYSINLSQKSMCARVTGIIYLKTKKINYNLHYGCFSIPVKAGLEQNEHLTDINDMNHDTDGSSDHVKRFVELQDEIAEKVE